MPRHARLRLAGCPWHVIQRGVNRSPCFADDTDRQRYLALFSEYAATHGCALHKRHGRTGTLWEGRFRSSVVDSEPYLLTCQQYIELNPVRAGMVGHPADYAWSSYLVNASGSPSGLVTPHELYLRLGRGSTERADAYRKLLRRNLSENHLKQIRDAINGGFALANAPFGHRVQATTDRPVLRRKPGRKRAEPTRQDGTDRSAPREKVVCPLFE